MQLRDNIVDALLVCARRYATLFCRRELSPFLCVAFAGSAAAPVVLPRLRRIGRPLPRLRVHDRVARLAGFAEAVQAIAHRALGRLGSDEIGQRAFSLSAVLGVYAPAARNTRATSACPPFSAC